VIAVFLRLMMCSFSVLATFLLQVKETQKSERNSASGLQKMAIGHHIGKTRLLLYFCQFFSCAGQNSGL